MLCIAVVFTAMLLFNSCQKRSAGSMSDVEKTEQIIEKVETWLDKQKATVPTAESANIELLKQNLDYTQHRFEKLNGNKDLLIIPIKEAFKVEKNVDREIISNLVLALDKTENIENAKMVFFKPKTPQSQVPENTFHNIYNNKPVELDGEVKFLSVGGRFIYSMGFSDGKISSYGRHTTKPSSITKQVPGQPDAKCTAYYLVISYYVDGILVNQTETYLGTYCTDNAPCDPMNQGFCPPGDGGGGEDPPIDCCIPDENAQFTSEASSNPGAVNCLTESIDPVSGKLTKTCFFEWPNFSRNNLLWYNWTYSITATGILEKEGDIWKFKEFTCEGAAIKGGQSPACTETDCTITNRAISISTDKRKAQLMMQYSSTMKITCWFNSPMVAPHNYTSTCNFNAP